MSKTMSLTYNEVRKLCTANRDKYPDPPRCNASRNVIEEWLNKHNLLQQDEKRPVVQKPLEYRDLQRLCSENKNKYPDAPSCKSSRVILEAWLQKHNITNGKVHVQPKGKEKAPTQPKGKEKAPTQPKGKEKAPTQPKGKEKAPTQPKGKGKAPTQPKGKEKVPTQPKGKGKAPTQPKGKGKAPTQPKGKGKAPTQPKGKGKVPIQPKGKGKVPIQPRDVVIGGNKYLQQAHPFVLDHETYSPTYLYSKEFTNQDKSSYRIGNVIAQGGFGKVTRVTKKKESFVMKESLKLTKNEIPQPYDLIEISSLSVLKHSNIIGISGVFQDAASVYISILLPMADKTLGGLDANEVKAFGYKNIAYQIMCGVAYLHSLHFTHNDIKPGNILCTLPNPSDRKGKVMLADMGSVRTHTCGVPLVRPSIPYTPAYAGPEMLLRIKVRSDAHDIWSVASTLYKIFAMKYLYTAAADRDAIIPGYFTTMGGFKEAEWPEGYSAIMGAMYIAKTTAAKQSTAKFIRDKKAELRTNLALRADGDMEPILAKMLAWNPDKRASIASLLKDTYWDSVRDASLEYEELSCNDSSVIRARHPNRSPLGTQVRQRTIRQGLQTISGTRISLLASEKGKYAAVQLFDELLNILEAKQMLPNTSTQEGKDLLGVYFLICIDIALMQDVVMQSTYSSILRMKAARMNGGETYNAKRLMVLQFLNYDLIFTTPHDYARGNDRLNSLFTSICLLFAISELYFNYDPEDIYKASMDVAEGKISTSVPHSRVKAALREAQTLLGGQNILQASTYALNTVINAYHQLK